MTTDEQALILASKTHLESIFDSIADPILIIDRDYGIRRLNLAASKYLNKDFRLAIGRRCFEEFHERTSPCENCPLERVLTEQATGSLQMEKEGPKGTQIFDLRYFPMLDKRGRVEGIVEHYVDITEGEEAKKKLESAYLQFREEMVLAQKVQEALLPRTLPDMPGLRIETYYHPYSEIGGDLYDFVRVDDAHWGLLIADVSGHGVPAALICAMAKMTFFLHAPGSPSPKRVFEVINQDLLKNLRTEFYITAFYAVWQPAHRLLRYAWAGHPTPLLLRAKTHQVEALKTDGFFLGMIPDGRFTELETPLAPGDRLLLYTDGLTDCRNTQKERFGVERLTALLAQSSGEPLAKVKTALLNQLHAFMGSIPSKDDITFVLIEIEK